MALEEPTVSELIRDLQTDIRGVADDVRELKDLQANYVSKELYDTHRANDERERETLLTRVATLEAKGRQWWTGFIMPAMVGVLLVLLPKVIK